MLQVIINIIEIIILVFTIIMALWVMITISTDVFKDFMKIRLPSIRKVYADNSKLAKKENIQNDTKEINGIDMEDPKTLLMDYYSQGLKQAKISFWFSIIFASIGFIVICATLLSLKTNTNMIEQNVAIFKLISGSIIESVSVFFFALSNKSRKLMVELFDKLRNDEKMNQSLNLIPKIQDEYLQSRVQSILSLNYSEVIIDDKIISILQEKQS